MNKISIKSIIMTADEFVALGNKPFAGHETIVIADKPTGVPGVLTAVDMQSALALARYKVQIVGQAPADRQETTE
ncbi:hypothetical protein B7Z17_02720 [Candidatus Saccharibacteria bacterium 32-49-10]|nr:MAG: hypothetical protein B7Z17_02720 [Candidatus Saccharibacteria bacterium 32-49-10]